MADTLARTLTLHHGSTPAETRWPYPVTTTNCGTFFALGDADPLAIEHSAFGQMLR